LIVLAAIFYKEFLKFRWTWLTVLVLNLALMAYLYVATRQLFILDHAEMVWYRVLHLGSIHYEMFKYAPAITGLLLGGIQYLPEMWGERLRLSLHLPLSPHLLILAHLLVGLTALGLAICVDLATLAWITSIHFPVDGVVTTVATALPWAVAGVAAYLGTTLGLLEPNYKRKIFNLVVSAGVVASLLQPTEPGGYALSLPYLAIMVILMVPTVLLPAYRFRYRRVS
jgi:hypothetical protein